MKPLKMSELRALLKRLFDGNVAVESFTTFEGSEDFSPGASFVLRSNRTGTRVTVWAQEVHRGWTLGEHNTTAGDPPRPRRTFGPTFTPSANQPDWLERLVHDAVADLHEAG